LKIAFRHWQSERANKGGEAQIMRRIGLRVALAAAVLTLVLPAAGRAEGGSVPSKDVERKIAYCKKCHGQMGQGLAAAHSIPRLAGQQIYYLEAKFGIISEHKRNNPTAEKFMAPVLETVDPEIRRAVATHFNGLEPPPAAGGPRELISEGRRLYESGSSEACTNCHGMDAKGSKDTPRLAGQIYPYLVKVLKNWTTINEEGGQVKAEAQHKLSEDQIAAVSSYLSNLK
jgi:cytochrome c553